MNPNINQNVQLMDILGQLTDRVMGPKNNPTFLGGVAQGLYESPGHMMGMVEGMRDIGLGRARPQYGPTLMGLGEQMGGYQVPDQGPASIGRAIGRNMLSVGAGVGEYIRQQGGGGWAQTAGEFAGDMFTGNPRALAALPVILRRTSRAAVEEAAMAGGPILTRRATKESGKVFTYRGENGETYSIVDNHALGDNEGSRYTVWREDPNGFQNLDDAESVEEAEEMIREIYDEDLAGGYWEDSLAGDVPGKVYSFTGDDGIGSYSIVDNHALGDTEGTRYTIWREDPENPTNLDDVDDLEEAKRLIREIYEEDLADGHWDGSD